MKKRLDVILVERGLAPTRQRAQALILSGNVLLNDEPATKAGQPVPEGAAIRVRGEEHPYVSRGGLKLARAVEAFSVQVKNRVALDVGASTGGFTHVLLMKGAAKVFAVDVGHNQLAWEIRSDMRVVVREKLNARDMKFEEIGQKVDLIVMDVSFISIEKILPNLLQFATPETDWITLIKPQFEVGREKVGKGGIVHDEADRQAVVERITRFGETLGLRRVGLIESPITGTDGNKEFLSHWKLFPPQKSIV